MLGMVKLKNAVCASPSPFLSMPPLCSCWDSVGIEKAVPSQRTARAEVHGAVRKGTPGGAVCSGLGEGK